MCIYIYIYIYINIYVYVALLPFVGGGGRARRISRVRLSPSRLVAQKMRIFLAGRVSCLFKKSIARGVKFNDVF